MRKYKILNLIDKSTIGGGQQFVYMIVKHVKGRFIPLLACSPGGPLIEKCLSHNINVSKIHMNKKFSPLSMLKIYNLVKKNRIDLIHVHGLVATVFGFFVSRIAGIPIIYSPYGFHHYNYRKGMIRNLRIKIEKFFTNRVNFVICASEKDRIKGIKKGYFNSDKSSVIYPPIEFSIFTPPSKEQIQKLKSDLKIPQNCFIVGTVGRLDIAKGYNYLLEAISIVKKCYPWILCLFIGEGKERKSLENLANHLRIKDHVRFLGIQPDVIPLYFLFDIFVSSSQWEGIPFVICEAMAAGRAVVATDVGGCSEIINHGETGIIVPPRNPLALAKGIIELMVDSNKRIKFGNKGKNKIAKICAIETIIKQFESIYQQVLKESELLNRKLKFSVKRG